MNLVLLEDSSVAYPGLDYHVDFTDSGLGTFVEVICNPF